MAWQFGLETTLKSEWKKLKNMGILGTIASFITIISAISAITYIIISKMAHLESMWSYMTDSPIVVILLVALVFNTFVTIRFARRISDMKEENEHILLKVRTDAEQAVKSVYVQKSGEVGELETEVASWKGKAACLQDGITLLERDLKTARSWLEKANKLELVVRYLNDAYRKKEGIITKNANVDMGIALVKEGSPEHLRKLSQDESYDKAIRLANEFGIDLSL
jgi:hypothetical protein